MAPAEALLLFVALMLIALGLVLTLNTLTITFAVAGAFITIIYPFTKRFLSTPQFVLGVAFSWGVPMAFAATAGDVPRVGWLLFLATVIWVVVYDTQYAMTDRPDDLKIGVRSTADAVRRARSRLHRWVCRCCCSRASCSSAAAPAWGPGTTGGSPPARCFASIRRT